MANRSTEELRKVTRSLLFSQGPASALEPALHELSSLLAGTRGNTPRQTQDSPLAGTQTADGLALSPAMASVCVDDFVRTIEFLRGTYAAIVDLRQQIADRPVRVLYVGCGPYATLALPLMTVFPSSEAVFVLLDIHPESIRSARSTVGRFGLDDSVSVFKTVDAVSYRISPDEPPDVILLEVMQACLESEPQVAIARNLLRQAPHAVLIPEEVRVELVLIDPSREFSTAGLESKQGPVERDRIGVAPVFVLNKEMVSSWDHHSTQLAATTVCMPEAWGEQYRPMLSTEIRIYKTHVLKGYGSGLTSPRALGLGGSIVPGAAIDFVYQLGAHPRLVGRTRSAEADGRKG